MQLLRLFLPGRATTDGVARIAFVRVAIIDVGANTLRLLVATRQKGAREKESEDRCKAAHMRAPGGDGSQVYARD